MNFPGKSLFDYLKEKKAREFDSGDMLPTVQTEAELGAPADDSNGFEIGIKRKRQSAMLKKMLHDSGYGELAKMISIRENKGD